MDELITKVEQWAKDKGLDQADSSKQMLKTIEEIGEVAASLARKDEHGLRDGIGDVVVTLIILAMQNDMDLYECLNQAYNEIKGRTGKMVDGVFVKSSDLEDSYEVEKEPLYYVKLPVVYFNHWDLEAYLMKDDRGNITIADNNDFDDMKFTESEIKEIDERYWPFAVPVEEVAEG